MESNELIISFSTLPASIDDLSKFVLIGREKLVAVRAAIRAIDKVGVAQDVYRQKLAEGQEIAEAVLDAEVKLGELRKSLIKEKGGRPEEKTPTSDDGSFDKTPVQKFDAMIAPKASPDCQSNQGRRFEVLASRPDIVEKVKATARETGELVTRSAVIKAIKAEEKAQKIETAKADIEAQAQQQEDKPTLYVGDSIRYKSPQPFDLLLTDPPYSTDVDNIEQFADSWLYSALENVKPTGFAYVFIGAYPEEVKAYLNAKIPSHIKLVQLLVWEYKNTLGNNPKDRYKQNYQMCLFFRGVDAPDLDCPITNEQWAVQEINAPDGRIGDRYHTWQKPMEIAERFIRHSTKKGMTVYDPFACTGTFLLAASKLGRKAVGFEVNPDNASIAERRGCKLEQQ